MSTQHSTEAIGAKTTPAASSARASFERPRFEAMTPHAVVSPISRELGWQVFGKANVPQLSPTIERELAGVKILEYHLGACAGRRLVTANTNGFFVVVHIIAGDEWRYGPRGAHRLCAGDIATWHSSQEVGFKVESSVHKIAYVF